MLATIPAIVVLTLLRRAAAWIGGEALLERAVDR
jgi:hypothetical protein